MLPTIMRRSYRPVFMPNFFSEDLFDGFQSRKSVPAVNIREDEKNYVLDLAIPGLDKKDLKIEVNEDVITISSEVKNETEENKDGYKRKEFSYSSFTRSFYIPEDADKEKIEAGYKDGVLSVTMPRQDMSQNKVSKTIEIA